MFIVDNSSEDYFVCLFVYLLCYFFSLSIWMFLNVHHKVLETFLASKKKGLFVYLLVSSILS